MPTIFAALIRQAKDPQWWRITTSHGGNMSFVNALVCKMVKHLMEKKE